MMGERNLIERKKMGGERMRGKAEKKVAKKRHSYLIKILDEQQTNLLCEFM